MNVVTANAAYSLTAVPDLSSITSVVLEQKKFNKKDQLTDLSDVALMFNLAMNDVSAFFHVPEGCPITIDENEDVTLALPFFVYSSPNSVTPILTSNVGVVDFVEELVVAKEFTRIFGLVKEIDLGFVILDYTIDWVSDVITENGDIVAPPVIKVVGTRLIAVTDVPIFAVVRVKAHVPTKVYTLSTLIEKQTGYDVENLVLTLTAMWGPEGDTKSKILEFEIPDCVYSALETCSDGSLKSKVVIKKSDDDEDEDDDEGKKGTVQIAYNNCNGDILKVRYV